jgi:UDP-N-acetylglucosamine--N-acetylmuramyl-(pentapeptide) pyrophosphoryl-undecaprenol N-acetylglucosamine transferase
VISGPFPYPRPCFLFCGGGTGGHLTPGLSAAIEIRRRLPDARILFAGTGRGREETWVRKHGFEFETLWASPWGASPWRAARFAVRTTGGLVGALRLETRLGASVVIGLGGYGALAPGLAAAICRIPLLLMEQNAVPGKANRLLSGWAREVYCAWGTAAAHLHRPDRAIVTGNPIRPELRGQGPANAARVFGLSPDRRTLLVMGGSQGAAAVNKAVVQALDALTDCAGWLQILHATGAPTYESVRDAYARSPIPHAVLPFIEDMAAAYAAADLVLSRAGGTSLAEITAAGLPSALVPLPIAAHDHQTANARVLAEAGAALIVPQQELTAERVADLARTLLQDETRLREMSRAARRLGTPDAADAVADRILRAAGIGEPAASCQTGRS